jgi:hypothetical protein
VFLNPKYLGGGAVGAPLQIDALLVIPPLYPFTVERSMQDILHADRVEREKRSLDVARLRLLRLCFSSCVKSRLFLVISVSH